MSINPYQAPSTSVADPEQAVHVSDSVYRDIRNAWTAAVISATLTFFLVELDAAPEQALDYATWEFFGVALMFALAYGIYRRSRICAVLLLSYFIAVKGYSLQQDESLASLPFALIFIYLYIRGVIGTFRYQKAAHGA